MWPNPQFLADLVTFTEEILNGKLCFLCSVFIIQFASLNITSSFCLVNFAQKFMLLAIEASYSLLVVTSLNCKIKKSAFPITTWWYNCQFFHIAINGSFINEQKVCKTKKTKQNKKTNGDKNLWNGNSNQNQTALKRLLGLLLKWNIFHVPQIFQIENINQ